MANKGLSPCYLSDGPETQQLGAGGTEAAFYDDFSQLTRKTLIKGDANVSGKWGSVSANASRERERTTTSTRTHYVIRAWNPPVVQTPKNLRLTERGKALASHGPRFQAYCGPGVVTAVLRQAEARIIYTVDGEDAKRISKFKSDVRGKAKFKTAVEAGAVFNDLTETETKKLNVEMSVAHTGRSGSAGLLVPAFDRKKEKARSGGALEAVAASLGSPAATDLSSAPITDFTVEDPSTIFEINTEGWAEFRVLTQRRMGWWRLQEELERTHTEFEEAKFGRYRALPVEWCEDCVGCPEASAAAKKAAVGAFNAAADCHQQALDCRDGDGTCRVNEATCGEPFPPSNVPSILSCLKPPATSVRWVGKVASAHYSFGEEQIYFQATVWPELGVTTGVVPEKIEVRSGDRKNASFKLPKPRVGENGVRWFSLADFFSATVTHRSKHEPGSFWYCWGGTANRGCDAKASNHAFLLTQALRESGFGDSSIELSFAGGDTPIGPQPLEGHEVVLDPQAKP